MNVSVTRSFVVAPNCAQPDLSADFFDRLTNHRDCTFRIAARVRLYMEENPIGGDE